MRIPENMSGFGKDLGQRTSRAAIGMNAPQMVETEDASPEEQEIYNAYVNAARIMIFDKSARQGVVDMLQSSEDPKEGLGAVAGAVASRAAQEIAKSRREPVSPEIILEGMDEIITAAVEMAEAAGLPEYDQKALDGALISAVDQVRVSLQDGAGLDKSAAKEDLETAKGLSEDEIAARFGGAA